MSNFDMAKSIRALREMNGYSRQRLAIKAGLSFETIQRVEQGKGTINVTTAVKLADALNVTLDELVGRVVR